MIRNKNSGLPVARPGVRWRCLITINRLGTVMTALILVLYAGIHPRTAIVTDPSKRRRTMLD